MLEEYWKSRLSFNGKRLYENMLVSFTRQCDKVSCGNMKPQEIFDIYFALYNDHPELYQLAHNPEITQQLSILGRDCSIAIHNVYDRNSAKKYEKAIENLKEDFKDKASNFTSPYELEKLVCDYIIENVNYEINNQYYQNAASVLVDHKGQCSGIAKAVKLMLSWVNIDSMIVNGNANDLSKGVSGKHSWNIVNIKGMYHHLDATFMLGVNKSKTKPYRYLYLNYDDEEIRKDHSWDFNSTPRCVESKETENESNQKVITCLYELRLELKKSIESGKQSLSFTSTIQVSDDKLYYNVEKCCKDVIKQLNQTRTISIAIRGKQVNLSW